MRRVCSLNAMRRICVHLQYVNGSLLNAILTVCSSAAMITVCNLNGSSGPTKLWSCKRIKKSMLLSLELFDSKEYKAGFIECYVLQLCHKITITSGTDLPSS